MKAFGLIVGPLLFSGVILLSLGGCDSGTSTAPAGSGGNDGSGGKATTGGSVSSSANAGTTSTISTAGAAPILDTPSKVVTDGYVTTGPWAGYGFTATDPGAAVIVPNCGGGACVPAYQGTSFCMHGTVTGRADYTGFAMLGWNVNQAAGTGTAALTWNVPDSGGLVVTVDNPSNTPLRVQLQGTDPHSGADRWCAPLVNGTLIPWGSLVTNCWSGGTPQNALTPGTVIQQASIIVPGTLSDLPFSFCLVDVVIQ